jgi:acetylornithine deacetylase/succinyl-diaminopimelate desuccinylase-like protein
MVHTALFVKSTSGIRLRVGLSLADRRYLYRSLHIPSINATRLNETIHTTSVWGAAHRWGSLETETGMARLALSDDDAKVRRWFVEQTKALGCTVTIDQMGNTFAVRHGLRDGPPTAIGSHLDTQPSGGRYDGVLGVMAGLEALRTIVEENITTNYPIAVINWTKSALGCFCDWWHVYPLLLWHSEEGARFPKSIVSSAVWAGVTSLEDAWNLKEVVGDATQKSELQRIGFLGDTPCSYKAMPLGGHFELHIGEISRVGPDLSFIWTIAEQGPHLEASSLKVGVVKGAQAVRWYTVTVSGRECHTGSTPFFARSDAMLCAAKIIVASNAIAKAHKGLASTGILHAFPGSTNTVPGKVVLSLDMRHPQNSALDALDAALHKEVDRIAREDSERGCMVDLRLDTDTKAMVFNEDCIRCVRDSADAVVGRENATELISGAGHDR